MVLDFILGSGSYMLSDGLPVSQTLERNGLEQEEFPCTKVIRIERMYVRMTRSRTHQRPSPL